ncbi:MAG TPA: tyrosine-type recombinase/integrase [Candidatus Saccharimonadales bacterium]|nr:tyrosine-type recombinase/integrase [Candidatus Saccharimonadales bacterium]
MGNLQRLTGLAAFKLGLADGLSTDDVARWLALYGLRRGEVLGLRWCDVDFEHGVLRIRQQIQRINGALQQVELKTESSNGDEPLLDSARRVLLTRREEQAAARVSAGDAWQGSGTVAELVFTTRTGRPIEPRNLYRSFLRLCQLHNLRRITPTAYGTVTQPGLRIAVFMIAIFRASFATTPYIRHACTSM